MGYTSSDVSCVLSKRECRRPTLLTDRSKLAVTMHQQSERWFVYTMYSLESYLSDPRAHGSQREKETPRTRDEKYSIRSQGNRSYCLSRISENVNAFSMEISSSNGRHLRNGPFCCSGECWSRCCRYSRRFRGRYPPTSRAYLSRFRCSQATRP